MPSPIPKNRNKFKEEEDNPLQSPESWGPSTWSKWGSVSPSRTHWEVGRDGGAGGGGYMRSHTSNLQIARQLLYLSPSAMLTWKEIKREGIVLRITSGLPAFQRPMPVDFVVVVFFPQTATVPWVLLSSVNLPNSETRLCDGWSLNKKKIQILVLCLLKVVAACGCQIRLANLTPPRLESSAGLQVSTLGFQPAA